MKRNFYATERRKRPIVHFLLSFEVRLKLYISEPNC